MTPSRDDAAVFTRIFDQHRHAVHAYFLGRVADPELARDLLQETFLRVWRRLSEIAPLPGEQQRAWIFTVARNLAIDSYRVSAARNSPPRSPNRRAYSSWGGRSPHRCRTRYSLTTTANGTPAASPRSGYRRR